MLADMQNSEPSGSMPLVVATVIVSIGMIALVVLAHVHEPVMGSHLADHVLNSLHGPGFAFVSVAILLILRVLRTGLSNYLIAAMVAGFIGLVSEVVQIPGPRDASASDLLADLVGITAGLGCIAVFDRSIRQKAKRWHLVGLGTAATIATAVAFVPTVLYAYAAVSQWRAMPVILSFERFWERATYGHFWP